MTDGKITDGNITDGVTTGRAATPPAPALVATDLSVRRGPVEVVRPLSLTLYAGRVLAVVGANGAGKTTLLEAISGVITPAGGTLMLGGVDVTTASRRARFRHGLVHVEQGRTVFPGLTVAENLSITARTPEALATAMGHFPALERRSALLAGLLSGGEQQMLVLARAMAASPRVLLVDEMSLGLAPAIFLTLLPMLRTIADSGVAVLVVEQFAHLALEMANDAMVLAGGRLTYDGPAAALAADPEQLHTYYLGTG